MIGPELVLLCIILLPLISLGLVTYFKSKRDLAQNAWSQFAQNNDLQFVPTLPPGQAYVIGHYRGRQLRLEATQLAPLGDASLQTCLTVIAQSSLNSDTGQPAGPVSDKTIPDILAALDFKLKGDLETETQGRNRQVITYRQSGLESQVDYLQSVLNLLCDLAEAYPASVALEGELIPALETVAARPNPHLRPLITQLIQGVNWATTSMFHNRLSELLCPHCLVRYAAHRVRLSWLAEPMIYYGCRRCGQSRNVLRWSGQITAVLDSGMTVERSEQAGVLRVNWLLRHDLFDFDSVEIIQASDEEVERFAVQLGNHIDPARPDHYRHLTCRVAPQCGLSIAYPFSCRPAGLFLC
jgi:hypothetical protein